MSFKGYREISRIEWGKSDSNYWTLDQINTGAFLRIADAVEKMAERHAELIQERDYFKGKVEELQAIRARLKRSNAGLRGHLKRILKEKT